MPSSSSYPHSLCDRLIESCGTEVRKSHLPISKRRKRHPWVIDNWPLFKLHLAPRAPVSGRIVATVAYPTANSRRSRSELH